MCLGRCALVCLPMSLISASVLILIQSPSFFSQFDYSWIFVILVDHANIVIVERISLVKIFNKIRFVLSMITANVFKNIMHLHEFEVFSFVSCVCMHVYEVVCENSIKRC